jgi:type II secretory pathway component PulF
VPEPFQEKCYAYKTSHLSLSIPRGLSPLARATASIDRDVCRVLVYFQSMTLVHRIRFYQQLAVLARAGVPLRASLQRMEKKIPGPEIGTLTRQIEQGRGSSIIRSSCSTFRSSSSR